MKKAAVIGFGYWGPNLCRVIHNSKYYILKVICEQSTDRREIARSKFSNVDLISDYKSIGDVDIVFIATPANTHLEIIRYFAHRDVLVFVEKPIVSTYSEFKFLTSMDFGKNIFVSNPFAYHGLTIELKNRLQQINKEELVSCRSSRASMGIVRNDTNILFDLGPHDISILKFLFETQEITDRYTQNVELHETIISKNLNFKYGEIPVNIYLDWFSPSKKRTLTIVTHSQIFECDFASNKLDVYDVLLSENRGRWEQKSTLVETFVPEPIEPLHLMVDSIFDDTPGSSSWALESEFWEPVYEVLFKL